MHLSMHRQDILSGISNAPLKFHTKYLAHALKDVILCMAEILKSSYMEKLTNVFETTLTSCFKKLYTHISQS